jgi:two-component system OmpR family sensor kinase
MTLVHRRELCHRGLVVAGGGSEECSGGSRPDSSSEVGDLREEEVVSESALLRDVLSMAHRIGKEAYWIQKLADRVRASIPDSDSASHDVETLVALASRVFEVSRDFRRVASRRAAEVRQRVPLVESVMNAVQIVAVAATSDRVVVELSEGVDDISTPAELKDVIVDLLQNALDASEDASPVIVSVFRESGEVVIRVLDQGSGMGADVLMKCDDFGFSTRLSTGGTGTGLALVSAVVRALHGRVDIRSEPGVGTVVEVGLPIA